MRRGLQPCGTLKEVVQSLQRDKVIEVELPVSVEQNDRTLAGGFDDAARAAARRRGHQRAVDRAAQSGGSGFLESAGSGGASNRASRPTKISKRSAWARSTTPEKARLAESITAAITWTHDQAVQVILDNAKAVVETGDQRAQATYRGRYPDEPALASLQGRLDQASQAG